MTNCCFERSSDFKTYSIIVKIPLRLHCFKVISEGQCQANYCLSKASTSVQIICTLVVKNIKECAFQRSYSISDATQLINKGTSFHNNGITTVKQKQECEILQPPDEGSVSSR